MTARVPAGMEKMAKVPTALNPQDYGIGSQTTPKWQKGQLKRSFLLVGILINAMHSQK